MSISENPGSSYMLVRRIGDVAVADTMNISLSNVESIQRWGEEMRGVIDSLKGNKLVINLGCTDYAPGPILHVLSSLNHYAATHKIKLALCEVGEENKKAFKLTRLNTVMTISEGERDAISAVRAHARRK